VEPVAKTEALMAVERRCEIADAKLQVAQSFRWGYAALASLAFNAQLHFPLGGIVVALLAFYVVPYTYRKELKLASSDLKKITGTPYQPKANPPAP